MSVEENKALVHRFVEEIIHQNNLAEVDQIFASNYVNHILPPGLPGGREGEKQYVAMFHAAFPDAHITFEDTIAEEDKVASRFTYRATHKGEFMGISPTNKEVTLTGIRIFRIAEGKIAEQWGESDNLGFMQQLGVIPPMG
jgi:predicted ester cyclase